MQIGRALGARVTGTARRENADLVRGLGATEVLDHETDALDRTGERFEVILHTGGRRSWPSYARLLTTTGRFVTTGFSAALAASAVTTRIASRRRIYFVRSRADGALMRAVSSLVAAGQLAAVIDSAWPLEAISQAYRRLETGRPCGKVVVTIS